MGATRLGAAPQVTYPLGDYAAKTLGYKRMGIVAEDFTYGHEGAGGFHLGFEAAGGQNRAKTLAAA
jgi:branched-chain amino acid transport system substrate-binding protein